MQAITILTLKKDKIKEDGSRLTIAPFQSTTKMNYLTMHLEENIKTGSTKSTLKETSRLPSKIRSIMPMYLFMSENSSSTQDCSQRRFQIAPHLKRFRRFMICAFLRTLK